MADPAKPDEKKEPTMAELQAMAEQAVKTAEEAKSAAEARSDVKEAVKEEGEAQGFEITEEQAEMIASVTITQLEQRGAFSGPGDGAGGDVPPAQLPEGAPPAEEGAEPVGSPPEQQPPAPVVPAEEPPPRRPTLAERFQGK